MNNVETSILIHYHELGLKEIIAIGLKKFLEAT